MYCVRGNLHRFDYIRRILDDNFKINQNHCFMHSYAFSCRVRLCCLWLA